MLTMHQYMRSAISILLSLSLGFVLFCSVCVGALFQLTFIHFTLNTKGESAAVHNHRLLISCTHSQAYNTCTRGDRRISCKFTAHTNRCSAFRVRFLTYDIVLARSLDVHFKNITVTEQKTRRLALSIGTTTN